MYSKVSRKNSEYENIKERKVLYEKANRKDTDKISSNMSQSSDSNNLNKNYLSNEKESPDLVGFQLNSSKTNINYSRSNIITNINHTPSKIILSEKSHEEEIEKKKNINLIKHLISFENLKYLKSLKQEIKEIIDSIKCPNEINNNTELNLKLHNLFKSNVFSEIFDNLLSKYFQNFYKCINTNPEFTSRIENILLYYFKLKNNMSPSSMIDLDHLFYLQLNNITASYSEKYLSNFSKSDSNLFSKDDNEINIQKNIDIEPLASTILPMSKTIK